MQAHSINDSTLVVSWEHPVNPNGEILNYTISIINLRDGSTVRQQMISQLGFTLRNLGTYNIADFCV